MVYINTVTTRAVLWPGGLHSNFAREPTWHHLTFSRQAAFMRQQVYTNESRLICVIKIKLIAFLTLRRRCNNPTSDIPIHKTAPGSCLTIERDYTTRQPRKTCVFSILGSINKMFPFGKPKV